MIEFPPGFTAEDVGEADLPALVEMIGEFFGEQQQHESTYAPAGDWRETVEQSVRAYLGQPEAFVKIARREGEPVGFIIFAVQTEPMLRSARQGVIHDIYVREPHRNQGLGDALVRHALWVLRHQDIELVTLNVLIANAQGIRFWERHGFEPYVQRMKASGRNPDHAPRPVRREW